MDHVISWRTETPRDMAPSSKKRQNLPAHSVKRKRILEEEKSVVLFGWVFRSRQPLRSAHFKLMSPVAIGARFGDK